MPEFRRGVQFTAALVCPHSTMSRAAVFMSATNRAPTSWMGRAAWEHCRGTASRARDHSQTDYGPLPSSELNAAFRVARWPEKG